MSNLDLFDCIQNEVNNIAAEVYSKDECAPKFIVSLLYEQGDSKVDRSHQIILTVLHKGYHFSKIIFPETKNIYGYTNLEETMKYMYNRTM